MCFFLAENILILSLSHIQPLISRAECIKNLSRIYSLNYFDMFSMHASAILSPFFLIPFSFISCCTDNEFLFRLIALAFKQSTLFYNQPALIFSHFLNFMFCSNLKENIELLLMATYKTMGKI